jgi:hypothetical protein
MDLITIDLRPLASQRPVTYSDRDPPTPDASMFPTVLPVTHTEDIEDDINIASRALILNVRK